jgi:hypothetical protein
MKQKGALRQLNISLQESDYEKFVQAFKKTVYRSKSSYARKLLLHKPVALISRNRSLDDFIELGVKLRKELRLLLDKETFSPVEKEALVRKMAVIEENLIKIVTLCTPK